MTQHFLSFSLLTWIFVEVVLQLRERSFVFSRNEHQQQTLVLFIFLGSLMAGWLSHWAGGRLPGNENVYRLVGGAIMLAGVCLRVWSVRTLGRFFRISVVIQDSHRVIQTGPYRLIRHPSYTGFLLAFLGYALSLHNWASILAILVGNGLGFHYRIKAEEQVLCDGLGEAYRQYQGRTWRLVPWLY